MQYSIQDTVEKSIAMNGSTVLILIVSISHQPAQVNVRFLDPIAQPISQAVCSLTVLLVDHSVMLL